MDAKEEADWTVGIWERGPAGSMMVKREGHDTAPVLGLTWKRCNNNGETVECRRQMASKLKQRADDCESDRCYPRDVSLLQRQTTVRMIIKTSQKPLRKFYFDC